ncbi:hypothetical protein P171DRAFT_423526 [Karstenula rhodostoma CBS 690.94]|uniref:ER transporter 6TM N-terminal domain-containing protein n=1 Tax=Karstenula rhodostoma CBS 690.94 TaxID=1392251 RepID=A0A9P4U638_9PLEO|nr:hypothetical protein P171DRAFT_423526 [Karstenula rhodostoma CBS 690.94]
MENTASSSSKSNGADVDAGENAARARNTADSKSEDPEAATKEDKPSILARINTKLMLDVPTVLMMLKAGLPPVIALSMYQADDIANTYTMLGYLMAIISILGFCIMPRAKFIQTMTINVIAVCLASAVSMLQLWSGVQARLNTTPPGLPPARYRYNSSQSAVCSIWLFFQIWLINSVKAKFPQFSFPCVLYSIFANVASTSGAMYQTTAQAEAFVKTLLEAFLTGFGIATVVSLLVLPVSCRKVVTKEVTGYVGALRGALKAHKEYFTSLETKDMLRQTMTILDEPEEGKDAREKIRPEITAVKTATAAITQLHGKLNVDLPFAKREIARGRLTPEDFESISKNLRAIMMPLVGVASVIDIFERLAELNGWEKELEEEMKQSVMDDWHHLMTFARGPIQNILDTMDQGLHHITLRLQLVTPPKTKKGTDTEAAGDMVRPGDKDFATHFAKQSEEFYTGRDKILRHWLGSKGHTVDDNFFEDVKEDAETQKLKLHQLGARHREQRQLFLVLYIVFLLHSVSEAILDFVKWADDHDQATTKKKFITPGKKRFRKWIASVCSTQDSNDDDESTNVGLNRTGVVVHMGEAYKGRKDPEHLEPENAWERFGDFVRSITTVLRSSESAFGFRVACATMSIGIIAYLSDTQLWFTRQRLVWAMLMVALGMTPTSGLSMFNFFWRIFGTLVAMLAAWLVWYIPNQKTPGILVLTYLFISAGHWVPLKRIDLIIPGLISMVTCVMIIGYELQVRKLGEAVATSNGQPFYKIIVLGPYRLACVVAGIAVAFFWTFFPYPITEHSTLRTKLGGSLYLAANLYSIMHETVMGRIRGDGGDPTDKSCPAYQLEKARNKVFAKQMLTLQALRQHSAMVNYEFPLGGKFPKKEYDAIIEYLSNITQYTALLGLASHTFTHPSLLPSSSDKDDPTRLAWFHDFRRLIATSNITSHEITSLLSMLSSSVTSSVPLPPYLSPPTAYSLSSKLEALDRDILSLKHIAEPGYAAFAVLQISTRCIQMDVERLLNRVKGLVGELDFSFHVVSTRVGSEETLVGGRRKED